MTKNYYILLGLPGDASEEDIRSAYRRLAKNFHPDHYGIDATPFLQIQEAYGVRWTPSVGQFFDENKVVDKLLGWVDFSLVL